MLTLRNVKSVVVNQKYFELKHRSKIPEDVALMKLPKAAPGVVPLSIAGSLPSETEDSFVYGFGSQFRHPLKFPDTRFSSETEKKKAFERFNAKSILNTELKSLQLKSVTVNTNNHGILDVSSLKGFTCGGDSGGPLVSNGQIIGLVSEGDPCRKAIDREKKDISFEKLRDFSFNAVQGREIINSLLIKLKKAPPLPTLEELQSSLYVIFLDIQLPALITKQLDNACRQLPYSEIIHHSKRLYLQMAYL